MICSVETFRIHMHNDKIWVQAICREEPCNWYIIILEIKDRDGFQIKHFVSDHTCGAHYINRKCDVEFLAQQYLPNFRDHPSSVFALQGQIWRDFNCEVPLHLYYKAKRRAFGKVH